MSSFLTIKPSSNKKIVGVWQLESVGSNSNPPKNIKIYNKDKTFEVHSLYTGKIIDGTYEITDGKILESVKVAKLYADKQILENKVNTLQYSRKGKKLHVRYEYNGRTATEVWVKKH
ncbi:MAG TPA: hypothetical protein PKA53_06575 [Sphingobacterium sp.]|nr:hypothetical protein [Sphingobacterium sp.]